MNICNICNGRFSIRINILSEQKNLYDCKYVVFYSRSKRRDLISIPERYNANMNVGEDGWSQNDKIIVR